MFIPTAYCLLPTAFMLNLFFPKNDRPPRTFAIGDVHGYFKPLKTIFKVIDPKKRDTIVMLGDYIDRGPDSKKVLQFLRKQSSKCNLIKLLGNHEDMLYQILTDEMAALCNTEDWLSWGGLQTLQSFDVRRPNELPKWVLEFLKECLTYYETADCIFAHARFKPDVPMEEQERDVLIWDKVFSTFDYPKHVSGKKGFIGHTAQKNGKLLVKDAFTCIDTCCYCGNWLTAINVDTGELIQANPDGTLRQN